MAPKPTDLFPPSFFIIAFFRLSLPAAREKELYAYFALNKFYKLVIEMNIWGIPDWLEEKVKKRDRLCAYCRIKLKEYPFTKGTPKDKVTLEHINNDGSPSEQNIVMCCASCNASKGTKKLSDWFNSDYCKEKKINKKTIKNIIVRRFLKKIGER